MKIIFDASSLINLVNGRVLEIVLNISHHEYYVGPIVYDECGDGSEPTITAALSNSKLSLLDDSTISATRFISLLTQFHLGNGETECLVFSIGSDFAIASDDRMARNVAEIQIGEKNVTGSLGLLKEAVEAALLSPDDAMESYREMRNKGGFLPVIDIHFFE